MSLWKLNLKIKEIMMPFGLINREKFMTAKMKADLINSKSNVSSQRWAFMIYTRISAFCAMVGFIAWIVFPFFNKAIDLMTLGGFLGIIIGLAGASKVSQSFAENSKTPPTDASPPKDAP